VAIALVIIISMLTHNAIAILVNIKLYGLVIFLQFKEKGITTLKASFCTLLNKNSGNF
jgi:hypothetical protein